MNINNGSSRSGKSRHARIPVGVYFIPIPFDSNFTNVLNRRLQETMGCTMEQLPSNATERLQWLVVHPDEWCRLVPHTEDDITDVLLFDTWLDAALMFVSQDDHTIDRP